EARLGPHARLRGTARPQPLRRPGAVVPAALAAVHGAVFPQLRKVPALARLPAHDTGPRATAARGRARLDSACRLSEHVRQGAAVLLRAASVPAARHVLAAGPGPLWLAGAAAQTGRHGGQPGTAAALHLRGLVRDAARA